MSTRKLRNGKNLEISEPDYFYPWCLLLGSTQCKQICGSPRPGVSTPTLHSATTSHLFCILTTTTRKLLCFRICSRRTKTYLIYVWIMNILLTFKYIYIIRQRWFIYSNCNFSCYTYCRIYKMFGSENSLFVR